MEMTTPMNYTEIAREILNKLERMETLQVKMAKQLEEMYFDEEPSDERSNVEQMERQRNNRNDDYDEEEAQPIKQERKQKKKKKTSDLVRTKVSFRKEM